jgi:polyhydroxyalkanoate synthase
VTAGREDPQPEPYQADRAFHAMLARLTGGISPVALSLAYMDWVSHLATAPQRQVEISQEAVRGARQFLDAALHGFSPQYVPWSLIKPKPQDRRLCRAGLGTPTVQSVRAGFLAERAMVA